MITTDQIVAAKAGDRAAKSAIVKDCHAYVRRCVQEQRRPDLAEDLIQAGLIGVLKAIDRFDLDRRTDDGKPIKFLTAAAWSIRDAIQAERMRLDSDGLTGTNGERQMLAVRETDRIEMAVKSGGRAPEGTTLRSTRERDRLAGRAVNRRSIVCASAQASRDQDAGRQLDGRLAAELLTDLPAQERRAFELRYMHEESWRVVAEELGVTAPTARALAERAKAKLRSRMR